MEDLPDSVLRLVLELCGGAELSALAMQSRRLRALVQEPQLWEAVARRQWPHADVRVYDGDWRGLCRGRAGMPPEYARLLDGNRRRLQESLGSWEVNNMRVHRALLAGRGGAGAGAGGPAGEAGDGERAEAALCGGDPLAAGGPLRDLFRIRDAQCWQPARAAEGRGLRGRHPREHEAYARHLLQVVHKAPWLVEGAAQRIFEVVSTEPEDAGGWVGPCEELTRACQVRSALQCVLEMMEAGHSAVKSDFLRYSHLKSILEWLDPHLEEWMCTHQHCRPEHYVTVPRQHWWFYMHEHDTFYTLGNVDWN